MMMMMKCLVVAATLVGLAHAETRVAVIELGKGGAVQRTTDTRDPLTTVAGVSSFWTVMHQRKGLQHPHMTVVPDLFRKPDAGMVVGLKGNGMDLDSMPFLSGLLYDEGNHGVVGHLEVNGNVGDALLSKVADSEDVDMSAFASSFSRHAKSEGLTGMITNIRGNNNIDNQLRELIQAAHSEALGEGKTVVLHLVVEEEEGSSRRRRLEDEEGEGEENEEGNENENNQNGNNNNGQQKNGYYGYGYYNSYGEWVTPYKSMFQIQYFNVVLWTSLGLGVILIFTIYLMVNMPLMPDTLLFGESAKIVGDD